MQAARRRKIEILSFRGSNTAMYSPHLRAIPTQQERRKLVRTLRGSPPGTAPLCDRRPCARCSFSPTYVCSNYSQCTTSEGTKPADHVSEVVAALPHALFDLSRPTHPRAHLVGTFARRSGRYPASLPERSASIALLPLPGDHGRRRRRGSTHRGQVARRVLDAKEHVFQLSLKPSSGGPPCWNAFPSTYPHKKELDHRITVPCCCTKHGG